MTTDAELVAGILAHTRPIPVCECGHSIAHHVTTPERHGCFPEVGPCDCRTFTAEDADEVPRGIERIVEAARELVSAADAMLGASFWTSYGYLRSEIEEYERRRE